MNQRARIETAIKEFADAQFECGEWRRDESDDTWDEVFVRAQRAERELLRAIFDN